MSLVATDARANNGATQALQIYACSNHCHTVGDALPDLKALTLEATGKQYRRIGRFIQLALIAAARCTQSQTLPNDTAVYLSSGRGDLETTVDIMTQLFRDGQTPKPLAFVNTVSNAACFYVAQLLNLKSRSNYVCNRHFAFESALQLALLDVRLGVVNSALVGSVDVVTTPIDQHRRRLQLTDEVALGESAHWLWLGAIDTTRPRCGELSEAWHFDDVEALLHWVTQQQLTADNCALSAGQFLSATEFADIQRRSGLKQTFDYGQHHGRQHDRQHGYYDSQSGAAIGVFLRSDSPQAQLLHINADAAGRYSIMLVKR